MTLLRQLADSGVTVLMVEQNVRTALKYADRALVLEMGRLALDRPASELLGIRSQPAFPRRPRPSSARRRGRAGRRAWR
jgi:ABC-type branched-subunit amino acid transport system ATPase component